MFFIIICDYEMGVEAMGRRGSWERITSSHPESLAVGASSLGSGSLPRVGRTILGQGRRTHLIWGMMVFCLSLHTGQQQGTPWEPPGGMLGGGTGSADSF